MKCAARGSLQMQDPKVAKNRHLGYIFTTKARIDNRKNFVKQQYLLHMSSQYGELRPTSS